MLGPDCLSAYPLINWYRWESFCSCIDFSFIYNGQILTICFPTTFDLNVIVKDFSKIKSIIFKVLVGRKRNIRVFIYNCIMLPTNKRTVTRWSSRHSRTIIASGKKVLQFSLRLLSSDPLGYSWLLGTFFTAFCRTMRRVSWNHCSFSEWRI